MAETVAKTTFVPLLLRGALAVIFVYQGLDLVGKEWGTAWSRDLPIPAQLAIAWGQLLGGAALGLGLLTRFAAGSIAVLIGVGFYPIVASRGLDLRNSGFEYHLAILVICLAAMALGGGTLAIDRLLGLKKKK